MLSIILVLVAAFALTKVGMTWFSTRNDAHGGGPRGESLAPPSDAAPSQAQRPEARTGSDEQSARAGIARSAGDRSLTAPFSRAGSDDVYGRDVATEDGGHEPGPYGQSAGAGIVQRTDLQTPDLPAADQPGAATSESAVASDADVAVAPIAAQAGQPEPTPAAPPEDAAGPGQTPPSTTPSQADGSNPDGSTGYGAGMGAPTVWSWPQFVPLNPVSVPCGPNTCNVGEVCCNASCGFCVTPGASCSTERCDGVVIPFSYPCGMSTCNVGQVCCNPACGLCADAESCKNQRCP